MPSLEQRPGIRAGRAGRGWGRVRLYFNPPEQDGRYASGRLSARSSEIYHSALENGPGFSPEQDGRYASGRLSARSSEIYGRRPVCPIYGVLFCQGLPPLRHKLISFPLEESFFRTLPLYSLSRKAILKIEPPKQHSTPLRVAGSYLVVLTVTVPVGGSK
jgi:hypothetical protein